MSAQPTNRNQPITIDPVIIVHINMLIVPSAAVFAFGTLQIFIDRDLRATLSLGGARFPSAHAPANHCCFNGAAGIHALPCAAAPSAQEWNDIRADVILAQELKRLVRWWYAFMNEGIDALLPRCHANSPYSKVYDDFERSNRRVPSRA
jgi:hypothetical protein